MAAKVEIISTETIKPFSPTPDHLRTIKLSLLDQLTLPFYVCAVYFYENNPTTATFMNATKKSHLLKKSLSKTLTHFYPLAGRLNIDGLSIDCNDQGVEYNESQVSCDMARFLRHPSSYMLKKLTKRDPEGVRNELGSNEEILSVQVNHFKCGGIAISVSVFHEVADAASMATFASVWSEIARNNNDDVNVVDGKSFVFDCKHIFPPREDLAASSNLVGKVFKYNYMKQQKTSARRFVFDKLKIDALRDKLAYQDDNDSGSHRRPTRIEAVTAFIWGLLVSLTIDMKNGVHGELEVKKVMKKTKCQMYHIVNVRSRVNPPFPPHSLGSIIQEGEIVEWTLEEEEKNIVDYKVVARKIHESINVINDEYLRTVVGSDKFFLSRKDLMITPQIDLVLFTSWCRFPFYDTDFGWGKPVWVVPISLANNTLDIVILIDTIDGEGMEAWVKVNNEMIGKILEDNPELLAYASLNPNPLSST